MKRCKNCGFSNPDTNFTCEKCGSSLGGQPAQSARDSVQGMSSNATRNYGGIDLKRTVADSEAFREILNNANGNNMMNAMHPAKNECPKCGYKMLPGETECPNCGWKSEDAKPHIIASEPKKVGKHNVPQQTPLGGTVTPWSDMYPTIGNCKLTPIGYEGEKEVPEAIVLSGNEHILKRENTDPFNKTITSKEQAIVIKKDGVWYIQDKSVMGTTFVLAKPEIALKNGDIIMLGNRRFVFNGD